MKLVCNELYVITTLPFDFINFSPCLMDGFWGIEPAFPSDSKRNQSIECNPADSASGLAPPSLGFNSTKWSNPPSVTMTCARQCPLSPFISSKSFSKSLYLIGCEDEYLLVPEDWVQVEWRWNCFISLITWMTGVGRMFKVWIPMTEHWN